MSKKIILIQQLASDDNERIVLRPSKSTIKAYNIDCYSTAIGLLFDWFSTAFTSLNSVY